MLWCRFQQCLGTFTVLLVEGSTETEIFRDFSRHVFGVRNFGNAESMRVIFFLKIFKIWARFQKSCKKLRKPFIFWDNCIRTGIAKLSLLRTGYLSSASKLLTSSPKIWHVNKRDFFQLNWLGTDQSIC